MTTYAHGSHDYGNSYQLQSIKADVSQAKGTATSFSDNLRPDFGHHSVTVQHVNENKERKKASSIESGGSREMIIRKDVAQWSQLLGRRLEPMGRARQAFSSGPAHKAHVACT
jgi:FAD synthase